MIDPNNREFILKGKAAPIRLARIYAQGMGLLDAAYVTNWTPGPGYGTRRESTWAEKRARVASFMDKAKAALAKSQAYTERQERAWQEHGAELLAIKRQIEELENKPDRWNTKPDLEYLQSRYDAIIEAA